MQQKVNSRSNNRNRKRSLIKPARGAKLDLVRQIITIKPTRTLILIPNTQRRLQRLTTTRMRAIPRKRRNGHKPASEDDIQDDAQERKDGDAAEEESQDDGEKRVEQGQPADARDGLLPPGDAFTAIGEHGEEVAVEAEDDGGAREGDEVEEGLAAAQGEAAEFAHGGCD